MSDLEEMLGIDPNDPEDRLADHLVTQHEDVLLDGLIKVRQERGLSLDDIAERMGIGREYVARIEAGVRDPRLSMLRWYAFAVGARIEHTVTADEDVTRRPGVASGWTKGGA